MKELEVNYAVDYKDQHIGDAIKEIFPDGVDLILDCVSGQSLQQGLSSPKSGGKVISTLTQGKEIDPEVDFQFIFVEPNSQHLRHLQKLADSDKLKVKITKTYSLEEAAEAMEQIKSKHTTGKIVIVP